MTLERVPLAVIRSELLYPGKLVFRAENLYAQAMEHSTIKVRAIGQSNFNMEQSKEILSLCEVKPAILQTEVHPYFQEKELKKSITGQESIA